MRNPGPTRCTGENQRVQMYERADALHYCAPRNTITILTCMHFVCRVRTPFVSWLAGEWLVRELHLFCGKVSSGTSYPFPCTVSPLAPPLHHCAQAGCVRLGTADHPLPPGGIACCIHHAPGLLHGCRHSADSWSRALASGPRCRTQPGPSLQPPPKGAYAWTIHRVALRGLRLIRHRNAASRSAARRPVGCR